MGREETGERCERCGGPVRIQGQATISAPAELAHNFTKRNLRRKDVQLEGVNWETMDFLCASEDCGYVRLAYGNYVSRLQRECEALRAEVRSLREGKEQTP